MVMTVNWEKVTSMLIKDWDKLTLGKKQLNITIIANWWPKAKFNYHVCVYCPYIGGFGSQYFNSLQDAQKWLAGQLSDMIEEEFRRQYAEQVDKEAEEAKGIMDKSVNAITLEEGNINSIQITWIPEKQELEIKRYDGRYFDKYIQFEESPIKLTEFFKKLGITKDDINKALNG